MLAPSPPPGPRTALRCLLAAAAALTGCEYVTVIGIREIDEGPVDLDEDTDESAETQPPDLDLPDEYCEPPAKVSCDQDSEDPLHAVGLDCVGGTPSSGGAEGPSGAIATHAGTIGPYAPREGERFLILSTGMAEQLAMTQTQLAALGCTDPDYCPSTDFDSEPTQLPAPIDVSPVDASGETNCNTNSALIGTGDCSNSLYEQWSACPDGCALWDYSELRIGLTVPEHSYGLAFDFAFMSVEWPQFTGGAFNDMFVAWLESEAWTGNISFDAFGSPITVNAGFINYTGDALAGFAMEGHGATRWLTTDVGVQPGEPLLLVLAIFDLSDASYDSLVLLDDVRWTCSATPPTTQPVP
ncbi:hypothetical protein G6O69_35550 [Pseudenhygromyxa sp. WMMC2535]|uniref:choice-of-anchor L domain-containing protein n=1 Tax=Pseudenhygromyxa sp. WMMC2535 TaxID=2712867 RepID=UPI0015529FCF|nr:choice-of-anchor L domain-containing protein [Pseudenhygromyxa sp. WMMC2535]NVB43194.1 hypothetical protein [Pseudenhygromyxa sp. WMMC2535]